MGKAMDMAVKANEEIAEGDLKKYGIDVELDQELAWVLLEIVHVLREQNDIISEARQNTVPEAHVLGVADRDLHVAQGDQHGLDHRGVLCEVEPHLVGSTVVQTEQWVPVV